MEDKMRTHVGAKFGLLEIVERPKDRPGIRICRCKCGKLVEVEARSLTSGFVTACRKCRPAGTCRFNGGVNCRNLEADECLDCGWNPMVAKARSAILAEKKEAPKGFFKKGWSRV